MTATPPDITRILSEVLDIDATAVDDDLGPATCAAWTSMKHVELMVTFEDLFGIDLTSREMAEVSDVARLRHLLRAKGVSVSLDERSVS